MSRFLSYLLRHGATKEGLTISQDGYVSVNDILSYMSKNNSDILTLEQLQKITNEDKKNRFSLVNRDGSWYMRANQGHSIQAVNESALTEITEPIEAIHGTIKKNLPLILSNGLSKWNETTFILQLVK